MNEAIETVTALIEINSLAEAVPEWPFSPFATYALIRRKRLRCVKVGRRVFVTRDLLEDFIKGHTI